MTMFHPDLEDVLASTTSQNALSAAMLLKITIVAVVCTNAGLVVGLVGALCGSAIIYIIPSILYAKALESMQAKDQHILEIALASAVGFVGLVLGIAGVLSSLDSAKIISTR